MLLLVVVYCGLLIKFDSKSGASTNSATPVFLYHTCQKQSFLNLIMPKHSLI